MNIRPPTAVASEAGGRAPDLLIAGDYVVVSPGHVVRDAAVVVRGHTIIAVGPARDLSPLYPRARRYGGARRMVMPGLINTHTHLFQAFLKGLGDGLPLAEWVRRVTVPAALALTPREAYLAAMVSLMDALRSGTTAVFEYSYALPDTAVHLASLQAFVDLGLRGWLGIGLNDAGAASGLHPALIEPIDQGLKRVDTLRAELAQAGAGLVLPALTPTSIRGLSPHGLRAVAGYCRANALMFSLHVNESDLDNRIAREVFGTQTVPALAEAEALDPNFLAVHCVRMSDADIELLAQSGAGVSHNPVSNLYLGSGIAPVMALRKAGIPVGLGTDGAASNNCQDMLEVMKFAALGQRGAAGGPDAFTATEALALATAEGARALRQEARLGTLAAGYAADLVVLRLDTPRTAPVHDPVAALVFSANATNVETVVVGGRVVLDHGHFPGVDEEALLAEAQQAARALVGRAHIL